MNQKPFLGIIPNTLLVSESETNATPLRLVRDAAVVDADWAGGTLTISGLASDDRVGIATDGVVTLSAAFLQVNGVAVGALSGGQGTTLTIEFFSYTTTAQVEAVIEHLTFQNLSDKPTPTRDLQITLRDQAGATWHDSGAQFTQTADPWKPVPGIDADRPYEYDLDGYSGPLSGPAAYDADGNGQAEALVFGTRSGSLRYFERVDGVLVEQKTALSNPFSTIDVGVHNSTISIDGFAKPAFGDIDLDGDLDLVVGVVDGTLKTFENRDGAFQELAGTANPFRFINVGADAAPAFFLEDGRANLVVGGANGRLNLFMQVAPDLYLQRSELGSVDVGDYSTPTAADINGDGRADLVVGSADGTFRTFLAGPGLTFVEQTGPGNPFAGRDIGGGSAPAFFDVNGDGRPDLVSGTTNGDLATFTGKAPLEVTVAAQNDAPELNGLPNGFKVAENASNAAPLAFASAVTFRDGDFGGGRITVSGLLAEDRVGLVTDGTVSVAANLVRVNGTAVGVVDGGAGTAFTVFLSGAATAATVQTLVRHLTYQNVSDSPTASRELSVVVQDETGERSDDVHPAEFRSDFDPTGLHPGLTSTETRRVTAPALADLNGDGRLDIVVGSSGFVQVRSGDSYIGSTDYHAMTFFQNADGSFTEQTGSANPFRNITTEFSKPALVDLNGDGRVDAVFGAKEAGKVSVAIQGSDGYFRPASASENPFENTYRGDYSTYAIGDLNNDGRFDVVTSDASGLLIAYTVRDGEGNFLPAFSPPSGIDLGNDAFVPALVDLNGDKRLDLVVGQQSGHLRTFFQDAGGRFNEARGADNPLSGIYVAAENAENTAEYLSLAPAFGDIDNDGDIDLVLGGELFGPLRIFTNNAPLPSRSAIRVEVTPEGEPSNVSGDLAGSVTEAGGILNGDRGEPSASGRLRADGGDDRRFQEVVPGTSARFGTYEVSGSGTWRYRLNDANADVQNLRAGDEIQDRFTVRTLDGGEATVRVTIHGADDASVISGAVAGSVTEAGGAANGTAGAPTATGRLFAADVDGRPDRFDDVARGTMSTGTYEVTSKGEWTYRLDDARPAVQALKAGETLTDTFTVFAEDGTPQVVRITVNGANDAAVVSGAVAGAVVEAGGVANAASGVPVARGTLLAADPDNQPNAFQAVAAGTPARYGTYEVTSDGTWTYTLDNTDLTVERLRPGDRLTDTFTVLTEDGTPQLVTVTVEGTNDAAFLLGTRTGTAVEAGGVANGTAGRPVVIGEFSSTDFDNSSDSFQAAPAGSVSSRGYGTYEMTAGGEWAYRLDDAHPAVQALKPGGTLTDTFAIFAEDGTSEVVTITIEGANDAPVVAASLIDQGVAEDAAWSFTLPAGSFSDVDGDALRLSANLADGSALPAWLAFDAATATFSGTPPKDFNGSLSVRVTAADGKLSASDAFDLVVTPVNDAPVLSGDGAIEILRSGSVVLTTADLSAGDVDSPVSSLTYTVDAASRGSVMVGNAAVTAFTQAQLAGGAVSFRHDGSAGAEAGFTVRVGDGEATSDARTIRAAVDAAPTVTGIAYGANDGTLKAGETISLVLSASESVTVTGVPVLTLSDGGTARYVSGSGTGTLVFAHTVAAGQTAGDLTVLGLSGGAIRDAAGQSLLALPAGGLNPAGSVAVDTQAPVAGADTLTVAAKTGQVAGTVINGTASVLANDSDTQSPAGSLVLVGAKAGTASGTAIQPVSVAPLVLDGARGSLAIGADGAYSYTLGRGYDLLDAGQKAKDSFTYVVADLAGNQSVQTLTIDLTGIANAPAVASDIVGVGLLGSTKVDASRGVLANDAAIDASFRLAVTAVEFEGRTVSVAPGKTSTIQGDYGTLSVGADGGYSYVSTLKGAIAQLSNPEIVPQDSFTYTVNDGHGGQSRSTLTATVGVTGLQNYVQGTDGNDVLTFTNSKTILGKVFGIDDAMIFAGGNGDDVITGGRSADVLIGGGGSDVLTGGLGRDTFVLNEGAFHSIVTDFKSGTDHLQFDHDIVASFSKVLSHAVQVGADVVIAADPDHVLTLRNVQLAHLQASDFFFA